MVTTESLLCASHVIAGAGQLPSPFTELTVSVSIRPPWQVQVRRLETKAGSGGSFGSSNFSKPRLGKQYSPFPKTLNSNNKVLVFGNIQAECN